MARATCLADTSTFARLTNPLVAQGQIALCAPVVSNSAAAHATWPTTGPSWIVLTPLSTSRSSTVIPAGCSCPTPLGRTRPTSRLVARRRSASCGCREQRSHSAPLRRRLRNGRQSHRPTPSGSSRAAQQTESSVTQVSSHKRSYEITEGTRRPVMDETRAILSAAVTSLARAT